MIPTRCPWCFSFTLTVTGKCRPFTKGYDVRCSTCGRAFVAPFDHKPQYNKLLRNKPQEDRDQQRIHEAQQEQDAMCQHRVQGTVIH
jgi:hypothetical protein